MPIDPSILLQERVKPYDPVEGASRIYALKNMMLQHQQAKQSMDTQEQLRRIAKSSDIATPEGRMQLAKGVAQVDPMSGMAMVQKNALAEQELGRARHENVLAELAAKKAKIQDLDSFRESQTSLMMAAQTRLKKTQDPAEQQRILENMSDAITSNAKAHGYYGGPENAPREAWDPAKLEQKINEGMGLKGQLEQAMKQAELELKKAGQETKDNRPTSDIGRIKADQASGLITEGEAKAAIRKATHIPPSMAQAATVGGAGFDPGKPLDPAMENQAKLIAKGEAPLMIPSNRNPLAMKINARADYLAKEGGDTGLSGTKHAQLKQSRLSFEPGRPNGQTIIALNTSVDHMSTMRKAVEALKNGDTRGANSILNRLGMEFGDSNVTNAETIAEVLAGEVDKVISGGNPTLAGHQAAKRMFATNGSPAQLYGAIEKATELLAGKLVALDTDHRRAFEGSSLAESKRLTPQTVKAFKSVLDHNEGTGTAIVKGPSGKALPPDMAKRVKALEEKGASPDEINAALKAAGY